MIMKKIQKINAGFLFFSITMALILVMSACKKNIERNPVITGVVNYAASPKDTAVQTVAAGQWVVLQGSNLGGVTQVTFNGVPATINSTLCTDGNIVIQIPSIAWQSVTKDQQNEITAVTGSGVASFKIKIVDAPLIVRIRNYEASPNDTIVSFVALGQYINLIGFNLAGADSITFQGIKADLSSAVYTDSSVIVKVPSDFTGGNASLANKITYTTKIGKQVFYIPIVDPAILKLYADPLFTFLTGGIGNKKTWVLDLDPATGNSKKFMGPIWWAGLDLGWDKQCGSGGSCWTYEVSYQGWFPAVKDYGTMTFQLKGNVVVEPVLTVTQKNGDATQNGTFTGSFFLDINAKTITFIDVVPLNFGWQYVFTKAYIMSLTADGMQLGFRDPVKSEYAVHNYILK
jgi:hypothetical protein